MARQSLGPDVITAQDLQADRWPDTVKEIRTASSSACVNLSLTFYRKLSDKSFFLKLLC